MTPSIDLFEAAEIESIECAALDAYMPIATERMKTIGMCGALAGAKSKVSHKYFDLLIKAGAQKRDAADRLSNAWFSALKRAEGGAA